MTLEEVHFQSDKLNDKNCIIFIGMAGAGKSTVGQALAQRLQWAFLDTDHLIEAHYGTTLQVVTDSMTKETFLDLEAEVVQKVDARRTIIATGGSVVYRPKAIQHLKTLGPLIYLNASLELTLERIAMNPDRGLAIAPGQTIQELYAERQALYSDAADYVLCCDAHTPLSCTDAVLDWLGEANEKA